MEPSRYGWIRVELTVKTKDHRTPLLWAAREGFEDVVRILLLNGANTYTEESEGFHNPVVGNHDEAQFRSTLAAKSMLC